MSGASLGRLFNVCERRGAWRINAVRAGQSLAFTSRGIARTARAINWEKLVYVPSGEVFTAVADIRPASPTLRQIETFRLGENTPLTLFRAAWSCPGVPRS
jgi:dTDP-4-dehydrorhamnose 3,5-epimerase-like enzyme